MLGERNLVVRLSFGSYSICQGPEKCRSLSGNQLPYEQCHPIVKPKPKYLSAIMFILRYANEEEFPYFSLQEPLCYAGHLSPSRKNKNKKIKKERTWQPQRSSNLPPLVLPKGLSSSLMVQKLPCSSFIHTTVESTARSQRQFHP